MTNGKLLSGQQLLPGQTLVSPGGQARLHYQSDGNLVVYLHGAPVWSSRTEGRTARKAVMQTDGNFVVLGQRGPVGATMTHDHPGAMIQLQNDGNFVVYEDPSGPRAGKPLWASAHSTFVSVPDAATPPSPIVRHRSPLVGQLSCDDTGFHDWSGRRVPLSYHAGDLVGQGLKFGVDHVIPAFNQIAEAGGHIVRVWHNVEPLPGTPAWDRFWGNKPASRWSVLDDPQRAKEIFNAGAERGLKFHIASGGLDNMGNGDEDRLFDLFADDIIPDVGPVVFAHIEACNEVQDTGDRDDREPAELERLINRIRGRWPQILYSLTAYTGTEDRDIQRRYTMPWMKFVLEHGFRGDRAHDKIRHLLSGVYEGDLVRRHKWHGEPFGVTRPEGPFGSLVSVQENSHELLEPGVMELAAVMGSLRGVWTFFCDPGIILYDEQFPDVPGFTGTGEVVNKLPQDLHQFQILGHSGRTKRGQRIHAVVDSSPEVRADYAIHHDGRYVEVIYGPPEQSHALPQERPTKDVTRLVDCWWGKVEVGQLA